jgi:cytidylate kinase
MEGRELMVVVAIDGPAGSGKSTIARALAVRLGVPHVDTGAYYRAATLAALEGGIDVDDEGLLAALAGRITIRRLEGRTLLDGRDVEEDIRSVAVDAAVSTVAAHRLVRGELLGRQRAAVGAAGAVVEGRDAGTNVVPDADLKVWLTASALVRAERRAAERALASGVDIDGDSIEEQAMALEERDHRDAANMGRADDIRVVDTTGSSVDEVVEHIVGVLESMEESS